MRKIKLSAFAENWPSDKDFFRNKTQYTVLYNGKTENELINDYGENDFLVIYDNTYYYAFRHFKLNHKHQHDYHFHFY